MSYKKVFLKAGKEESLKRFHPWIFSGAIHHIEGEPDEGEIVSVYTSQKEFIAIGHFQVGSIAVRVLTFRDEVIDSAFWETQVADSLRFAPQYRGGGESTQQIPTDWYMEKVITCPDW